jgi:glycosyltransferase involved in cell wall biosynthesis
MISVVLATHNEAKNIARCLDSVKEWADEIIVVDGESTDKTVALAKKYRAKIIPTTNKANFHINKQIAMDAAKGDLILQLDADEVVDEELTNFIHQIHTDLQTTNSRQATEPVAWWLKRRNFFLGHFLKKGGQYPDPVIRLYLRGKARLPQQDVHEQMVVDGPVGWADGHLLHYSYPTFDDYLRKFQTYTNFKATQLYEAGLRPGIGTGINYLMIKPMATFVSIFIRHKGFVDGVPGFVFAVFSGLHHAVAYLKMCEKTL